jgi:hypothetical protein
MLFFSDKSQFFATTNTCSGGHSEKSNWTCEKKCLSMKFPMNVLSDAYDYSSLPFLFFATGVGRIYLGHPVHLQFAKRCNYFSAI